MICQPFVPSLHEEEEEGISDVDEFVTATFEGSIETDESAAEDQRELEAKQKQEEIEAIKSEKWTALNLWLYCKRWRSLT